MTKRSKSKSKSGNENELGCGCFFIVLAFNIVFGGISVDYILSWFGKDIPFLADGLIGIFTGEFTIPVAIIGWILRLFGVF